MSTPSTTEPVPRHAYTMAEAAVALGMSRSHLYKLQKAGLIHTIKAAGCRRVRPAEIERFLDSCATNAK